VNVAYLVLAHNTPRNVSRLAAALRHPSHQIFIHVDGKADISSFRPAAAADATLLAQRVPVYWGDFSQVRASLALLRKAFEASTRFDYFVLMSGSDYPLYRAEDLNGFFASARGLEFISTVPIPCEAAGKGADRMTAFKPAGDPASLRYRAAALATRAVRHSRNHAKALGSMTPLAGSSWWAISRSAAQVVLEFVDRQSEKVRFFENTVCPDESFFQTIIGNSNRSHRIRRALVYADWSGGGSSPALIAERHLPLFQDHLRPSADDPYGPGIFLFARKLADDADDIRASIDAMRASKRLDGAWAFAEAAENAAPSA
jgi:hypothetical protein